MSAGGEPTDDTGVLLAEPGGTLLPTGGREYGHKGYNLALAIEALSQGLSGHGRADRPTGWGASVYVQVMDPDAFGGASRRAADRLHRRGLPQQSAGSRGRSRPSVRGAGPRAPAPGAGERDPALSRDHGGAWAERLQVAPPAPAH